MSYRERYYLVASPTEVGAPQVPTALPPITVGSTKQIEWAERIRSEYVTGANFAIMWWMGYTCDGETSARRAMGDLMPEQEAALIAQSIARFVADPGMDAGMWIDRYKKDPYREGKFAVGSLHRRYRGQE